MRLERLGDVQWRANPPQITEYCQPWLGIPCCCLAHVDGDTPVGLGETCPASGLVCIPPVLLRCQRGGLEKDCGHVSHKTLPATLPFLWSSLSVWCTDLHNANSPCWSTCSFMHALHPNRLNAVLCFHKINTQAASPMQV